MYVVGGFLIKENVMVTASARTNAIGHTVSGMESAIGGLMCKTDQFKISRADGKSHLFLDGELYKKKNSVQLGDLLSHSISSIQIMGQNIFENGGHLAQVVAIFLYVDGKRNHWEIRTKETRFMCINKRVYSRKID